MHEVPVTDDLHLSFQRFPYPADGVVSSTPPSRGALPVVLAAPDRLLVPRVAGEGFWIGVLPRSRGRPSALKILAEARPGERVDVVTGEPVNAAQWDSMGSVVVPPMHAVRGIFRTAGTWWAFPGWTDGRAPPACRRFEVLIWTLPRSVTEPAERSPTPLHQASGPPTGHATPGEPAPNLPPPGEATPLHIQLHDVADFDDAGEVEVPPLDDRAAYRGWKLP